MIAKAIRNRPDMILIEFQIIYDAYLILTEIRAHMKIHEMAR
jgi:hypothetical protein